MAKMNYNQEMVERLRRQEAMSQRFERPNRIDNATINRAQYSKPTYAASLAAAGSVGSAPIVHKDLAGKGQLTPTATSQAMGGVQGVLQAKDTIEALNKGTGSTDTTSSMAQNAMNYGLIGAQIGGAQGAIAGAVVGGGMGALTAAAARKKAARDLENRKLEQLAEIEMERGRNTQSILESMAAKIGNVLSQNPIVRL